MTFEEYSIKKEEIDNNRIKEENDSLTKIKNKYNNLYKELDNCRIKELNTVCIEAGDIITDGKVVLLVEKIEYVHGPNPDDCYIEFRGIEHTKKLMPKKQNERCFIQQRYGIIPVILKKREQ